MKRQNSSRLGLCCANVNSYRICERCVFTCAQ
uniref:Uncharacterized protein n=1 Tax=Anguilla anguilla TaxID=7936 RepID=A0A0E9T9S5_ANGAN